jgi:hypothetical protein
MDTPQPSSDPIATKIEFAEGKPWSCTSCGRQTLIEEAEYEPHPDDPDTDEAPELVGWPAYYDPTHGIALCDACDPGPEGPW